MNLIYPPICGICGKLDPNWLCKKCEISLLKNAKYGIDDYQGDFQKHYYIFPYKGMIRKMILDYKFNEKSYLYQTFIKILIKDEKFFQNLQNYDTIIPVPISKKRMKQRGYNQSLLIAKEIAKYAGLEYSGYNLVKTKDIIEQSKLNKQEREKNIQNVYQIKSANRLKSKKILLVDDIYTTGNTVKECSKILKEANPREISVFTLAKD